MQANSVPVITRGKFRIDAVVGGDLDNNSYLISSTDSFNQDVYVIDPAVNDDKINAVLNGRRLAGIVLTHGHYDHVHSASRLRALHGCKVYASAHEKDQIESPTWGADRHSLIPCVVDEVLEEGLSLEMGGVSWSVIETPGHTPGSICLYWDGLPNLNKGDLQSQSHEQGILISGDTLFCGTIGRIDFPESLPDLMKGSLVKLAGLPDDTLVLPGHYAYTSIKDERARALNMLLV